MISLEARFLTSLVTHLNQESEGSAGCDSVNVLLMIGDLRMLCQGKRRPGHVRYGVKLSSIIRRTSTHIIAGTLTAKPGLCSRLFRTVHTRLENSVKRES